MFDTPTARGSLEDAYDLSVVNAVSLRVQLRANETEARATMTAVASGIESTAANGHATKFATLSDDQRNLISSTFSTWRYLIDLHDEVRAYLPGTPTDEEIKNEMMLLLVPVREVGPDSYAGLRCSA